MPTQMCFVCFSNLGRKSSHMYGANNPTPLSYTRASPSWCSAVTPGETTEQPGVLRSKCTNNKSEWGSNSDSSNY